MKLHKKKGFAMLILLTFLFTTLFSTNIIGGMRVAEATMDEDCSTIAARITEEDLVSPKWYDRFCINHIDIAANLLATVTVDGKRYQEVVHLTPADAANVEITAQRNGTPVLFTESDISVNSLDMYGNVQIRVAGIFPIGTKANPVWYNVKITKDVTVNTGNSTTTVPVTFEVTTNYWDLYNACPALNLFRAEWMKGFFILGSGIDLFLGEGSAIAEPTCGILEIQKTVEGADAAGKTYIFDISRDGKLYKTVEMEMIGNTTVNALLHVPFGTYTVTERNTGMEMEGYTLTDVSYNPEGGTITLDAANQTVRVFVTNTYQKNEVPSVETDASFAIVKDEVRFISNNKGENVSAEQQETLRNRLFGFDVAAAVVPAGSGDFGTFEEARQAAMEAALPIETVTLARNGELMDNVAAADNSYYFHVDAVQQQQLNFDVNVTTTTGDAFLWLAISEDAESAKADGLEWSCKVYEGQTEIANGNTVFVPLTTGSVYTFVNTYKLPDASTPDNPTDPDPEDPEDPKDPDNPDPKDPENPDNPDPKDPDYPSNPFNPSEPGTPAEPGEPTITVPGEPVDNTTAEPEAPVEELPADVAQTGDNSHVLSYVLLMLFAVIGMITLWRRNRRA